MTLDTRTQPMPMWLQFLILSKLVLRATQDITKEKIYLIPKSYFFEIKTTKYLGKKIILQQKRLTIAESG